MCWNVWACLAVFASIVDISGSSYTAYRNMLKRVDINSNALRVGLCFKESLDKWGATCKRGPVMRTFQTGIYKIFHIASLQNCKIAKLHWLEVGDGIPVALSLYRSRGFFTKPRPSHELLRLWALVIIVVKNIARITNAVQVTVWLYSLLPNVIIQI